jgi:hypothetical protein
MKLLKILKIIITDKIYGSLNRDKRVTEINGLLHLHKNYYTDKVKTENGNEYVAEYGRHPFWYDDQPITIKEIFNKYKDWHVMHWLCYPNSNSKCGFNSSIVKGRFTKKHIYQWLINQSKIIDKILKRSII